MSIDHDAPALPRREPTISNADRAAIAKAARRELRDRFAMAALPGLLACPDFDHNIPFGEMACDAYAMADAMMKARGDD